MVTTGNSADAVPAAAPAAAAGHSNSFTGTARLLSRSQRDPQRGDLLLHLPGRLVVVDVCVKHLLASFASVAVAWGTGEPAEVEDLQKRDKYRRTSTRTHCFVPRSHETYGRAAPPCLCACP